MQAHDPLGSGCRDASSCRCGGRRQAAAAAAAAEHAKVSKSTTLSGAV